MGPDANPRHRVPLASKYGRYGYRRVTALLQAAEWQLGKDRVQWIWHCERLKVSPKTRRRSRLELNDWSCVRLPPLHRNHVWSSESIQAQTHDGRSLQILKLIDEHSQVCLAMNVTQRINSLGLIAALVDTNLLKCFRDNINCDNGRAIISKAPRYWATKLGP